MKSLKEEGVPFGARIVFRLQWLWKVVLAVAFLLTTPVILIWGLLHPSGEDFLHGVTEVLQGWQEQLRAQRTRLIAMYAKQTGEQ